MIVPRIVSNIEFMDYALYSWNLNFKKPGAIEIWVMANANDVQCERLAQIILEQIESHERSISEKDISI